MTKAKKIDKSTFGINTFQTKPIIGLFSCFCTTLVVCTQISATVVSVSNVQVSVPSGTSNPVGSGSSSSNPFIDDVFLESFDVVTAAGVTTLSRIGGNIQLGNTVRVRSGQAVVNAEYGDSDDGADGNPNPFVKAGLIAEGVAVPSSLSESVDPAIQNAAISQAINTYSINEGIDGEGASYTIDYFFDVTVTDNDLASDQLPEFLFFERGLNSGIIVQAIVGGDVDTPVLGGTAFTLGVSDFNATGIYTDTSEIGSGQELGVAGLDLTDLDIGTSTVLGLRVTSLGDTGADISGIFVTADQPNTQFSPNPVVPEPSTFLSLLFGLIFILFRKRV